MSYTFDTNKAVKDMEQAGISRPHAEAFTQTISAANAELATLEDLRNLEDRLSLRMDALRNELKGEIAALDVGTTERLVGLEAQTTEQISSLKEQIAASEARTTERLVGLEAQTTEQIGSLKEQIAASEVKTSKMMTKIILSQVAIAAVVVAVIRIPF